MQSWQPIRSSSAIHAIRIALDVATRLNDIGTLKHALESAARQQSKHTREIWSKPSLASGSTGLALVFSHLDQCFPDAGWDLAAKQHLELAARAIESVDEPQLGVFGGIVGVATAAYNASRGNTRYQGLLTSLDEVIAVRTERLCFEIKASAQWMSPVLFDTVYGLAGVVGYMAHRGFHRTASSVWRSSIDTLCWLALGTDPLPRWRTLPDQYLNPSYVAHSPYGLLDTGLAHGIAGPLAALSIALPYAGELSTKVTDAINGLATWLINSGFSDGYGLNWQAMIPLAPDNSGRLYPQIAPSSGERRPSRTAWCYGNPGISRALWLAGRATDTPLYCTIAIAAMQATLARPLNERNIASPTLCHGVAGLLQIVMRFVNDTGDGLFSYHAEELLSHVISRYAPQSILGYQEIDNDHRSIDNPAFLEGVAGIPLVLASACSETPPSWDRILLIN